MDREKIGNMCAVFQADCARLEQERIRPSESIQWAADAAFPGKWYRTGKRWWDKPAFGYWVLTSERLIRVWFVPETGLFSSRRFLKDRVEGTDDEWRVFLPPDSPLSAKEQASRHVKEAQVSRIIDVSLNRAEWRQATLFTVEASVVPSGTVWSYFWSQGDAEGLYRILQEVAGANLGPSPTSHASEATVPALLEALAKLRESGVLTDEEFENKKRELLRRI
jgi:hypothetical protein